jgi:hypothetical protein
MTEPPASVSNIVIVTISPAVDQLMWKDIPLLKWFKLLWHSGGNPHQGNGELSVRLDIAGPDRFPVSNNLAPCVAFRQEPRASHRRERQCRAAAPGQHQSLHERLSSPGDIIALDTLSSVLPGQIGA